jgi:ATP-dependent Clp protease, protease subunit
MPKDLPTAAEVAFQRLQVQRIVMLAAPIDDEIANVVVPQILYLADADPQANIYLYIDSPGGMVSAGMAIYDTMQFVQPQVCTRALRLAAGIATLLLAAGAPGYRQAMANSRIGLMPMTTGKPVGDAKLQSVEMAEIQTVLASKWAAHTGQTLAQIQQDIQQEFWLSANEALAYGLIDRILD